MLRIHGSSGPIGRVPFYFYRHRKSIYLLLERVDIGEELVICVSLTMQFLGGKVDRVSPT